MNYDTARIYARLKMLDVFERSAKDERSYQNFVAKLKKRKMTVADHINENVLGKDNVVWMKNEFPYDISGAIHYLLWSKRSMDDKTIGDLVACNVNGDYFYFVNPPILRSVPEVFHVHVIKRRS